MSGATMLRIGTALGSIAFSAKLLAVLVQTTQTFFVMH